MEWLVNAFWARIGWALGEVALFGVVALVIHVVFLAATVPKRLQQYRCKHLHYRETGACDAICNDCGKNLGFIGRIRDAQS